MTDPELWPPSPRASWSGRRGREAASGLPASPSLPPGRTAISAPASPQPQQGRALQGLCFGVKETGSFFLAVCHCSHPPSLPILTFATVRGEGGDDVTEHHLGAVRYLRPAGHLLSRAQDGTISELSPRRVFHVPVIVVPLSANSSGVSMETAVCR